MTQFDSTDPSTWPPTLIVNVGLCTAACCTAQTDEEAAAHLNCESPTGINSRWSAAADTADYSVPCPDDAARRHVLFEC